MLLKVGEGLSGHRATVRFARAGRASPHGLHKRDSEASVGAKGRRRDRDRGVV